MIRINAVSMKGRLFEGSFKRMENFFWSITAMGIYNHDIIIFLFLCYVQSATFW